MRIICDLDSIVVDLLTPWLKAHNEAQGDNLTVDKILTWDTHEFAKGGHAVYDVLNQPFFFRDLEPLPGAIQAIETLNDRGHEIFMVTAASYPVNFVDKVNWHAEFLPFLSKKNLVFAHEKYIIPADAIIDDGPHNATAYAKCHPHALVLGIEYPYNKDCEHYTMLAPSYNDPRAAWELILNELP